MPRAEVRQRSLTGIFFLTFSSFINLVVGFCREPRTRAAADTRRFRRRRARLNRDAAGRGASPTAGSARQ